MFEHNQQQIKRKTNKTKLYVFRKMDRKGVIHTGKGLTGDG